MASGQTSAGTRLKWSSLGRNSHICHRQYKLPLTTELFACAQELEKTQGSIHHQNWNDPVPANANGGKIVSKPHSLSTSQRLNEHLQSEERLIKVIWTQTLEGFKRTLIY